MEHRPEPNAFIKNLPKAELHLHLEGSVEPTILVELQKRRGISNPTIESAAQIYSYQDFSGFLMAFKAVSELLRTAEDYELIAYELMRQLMAQNVLHAEVYVSVGVCFYWKLDFDAIFEGLERGRERGERD